MIDLPTPSPLRILCGANYAVLQAAPWELYYGHGWSEVVDGRRGIFRACRCGDGCPPEARWHAAHGAGWPPWLNTRECLLYGIGLWLQARAEV